MGFQFDVFLSHNSQDKSSVRDVKDQLVNDGLRVWFDEEGLYGGEFWQDVVGEAIRNSKSVTVFVGSAGLGPWQKHEMQAALQLDNCRVIPVLLPGCPGPPNLPMFLSNRSWVDMRDGITEDAVKRLIRGIRGTTNNLRERPPKKKLIIILEMPFSHFSPRQNDGLRNELAGYLGIQSQDIDIVSIEEGSVTLLLPAERADHLLTAYRSHEPKLLAALKDFAPLRIESQSPRTSIPNNLPRLQPFFGREKELATIRDALDPENRTWGVLIDGPGGIGKTALAVRAAYDCPPGQFQRIVFLSAKEREMDAGGAYQLTGFILPGFLEMLNELARELGRPDITKSPQDQRIRLLVDALRPAQALLILDNLESLPRSDRDQLLTFVGRLPQGCKAILTGRRRIGAGAEELILEQLDETAALATLADRARHNPLLARTNESERITLCRQTGGNPLLLCWVAGKLGHGSCRTLPQALQFLRRCPPDNDPLAFIFDDLAKEFTSDETHVLCALTYFTLPAKVEHIVELAGCDKQDVETSARSLANRSLVIPNQEEEAFALVPMVAEFLRRRTPEVVAEIGCQLEKRAHAMILENGSEKFDRFPLLDAAWPTVAPALPLFLTGRNDRLQEVCGALHKFLEFTGRWDEKLALLRQAESEAEKAGDHTNAGWRAIEAGLTHALREEGDAVLACAKRAEDYWAKAEPGVRARAMANHLRGVGHCLNKDYATAIAVHREVIRLARAESAGRRDMAICLMALAKAEAGSGDVTAAERDYGEALDIAREVCDLERMASSTAGLVELALAREDWPMAEKLAREAQGLADKVGYLKLIAIACRGIGQSLLRQGKKAEAMPYDRRAAEIYRQLGGP